MSRTKLTWVQGNYLKLRIPLEVEKVEGNVKTSYHYKMPQGSDMAVTLIGHFHRHQFDNITPETEGAGGPNEQTILVMEDNGTIPVDDYAVEIKITEPNEAPYNGKNLRSMWKRILSMQYDNGGKMDEYDDFVGGESAELEAAVFYSHEGGDTTTAVQMAYARMGYYVCNTVGGDAKKTVSVPAEYNYVLGNGGSIKIFMEHANTAASGVTLNIGDKGAHALYYDGAAVSALNTWEDGETVEVYYVAAADNGNGAYFANNVAGGGKFKTGEKTRLTEISRDENESGDVYLPTVAKMNAGLALKENTSNKVTAFSETPTDAHYPSEKLVRDSIDAEAAERQRIDNGLQSQIDAIVGGNATVGLTVSQSAIFANTDTSVTATAEASMVADSIAIKKGSTTVQSAVNTTRATYTETLNMAGGTSVTFKAAFVIKGVNKTATDKTVTAYDKIYYGAGTENNHTGLSPVGIVKTSAAGTYSFTFTDDKKYIYILVPKTMSPNNPPIDLAKVKLPSGFGYNLQLVAQNEDYNGDGVLYWAYRSVADNNDNITLIIS